MSQFSDKEPPSEVLDKIKKEIYYTALDFVLLERLQEYLGALTRFQEDETLDQDLRTEASTLFKEIHEINTLVLNLQRKLLNMSEIEMHQHLSVVK